MKLKKIFRYVVPLLFALIHFPGCSGNEDNISSPDNSNYSIDYYLESGTVNSLISEIESGRFGEVNSLLIMRDDSLVVEEYFGRYSQNDLHVCYSVTKSFASSLIGIAYDKGLIRDTGSKLLDYFPEYNINQETKSRIKLEHVLTMSAGFEWNEWDINYFDSNNLLQRLSTSSDWISFILNRNIDSEPGEFFNYNSGLSVLLSGIILGVSGQRTSDFARSYLFNKLDITYFSWQEAPNNITNTGWGLSMLPSDLLKFGKLYLNKGKWNEEQIISEDWVNISTASHIKINEYYNYGYQWWRFSDNSTTAKVLEQNDVFYADGFGNQYIFVIPHLNMVVVSTAENFSNNKNSIYMLRDYILPAAYSAAR